MRINRRKFLGNGLTALGSAVVLGCSTIKPADSGTRKFWRPSSFQKIEQVLIEDRNVKLRHKHFISQDYPTLIVIGEFHRKKDVQVDQYAVLENIARNTEVSLLLRENHPRKKRIDRGRIKPIFELYGRVNSAADLSRFYGDNEGIGKLYLADRKLVRRYSSSLPPPSDFYASTLTKAYNLLVSERKLSSLEKGILEALEKIRIPTIEEKNYIESQDGIRVDQAAASVFVYTHPEILSFGVDSDVNEDEAIDTLDGLFYALHRIKKTRILTSDEEHLFSALDRYEHEFVIEGRSREIVNEATNLIKCVGSNTSVLIIGHSHEKSTVEALKDKAVNSFYLTVPSMNTYSQEDLFTIIKK